MKLLKLLIMAAAPLFAATLAACDNGGDEKPATQAQLSIISPTVENDSIVVKVLSAGNSDTPYIVGLVSDFEGSDYAELFDGYVELLAQQVENGTASWDEIIKRGNTTTYFPGVLYNTEYTAFAAAVKRSGSSWVRNSEVRSRTFTVEQPAVSGKPLSSLDKDYTFDNIQNVSLTFYPDGEGLYRVSLGVNAWELVLQSSKGGNRSELCSIEFYTALDNDEPAGLFTVNDIFAGALMQADTFSRGYAYMDDFGYLYTFDGSYWYDFDASNIYNAATLHDGTLTITKNDDGTYTFKGDFLDKGEGSDNLNPVKFMFDHTSAVKISDGTKH